MAFAIERDRRTAGQLDTRLGDPGGRGTAELLGGGCRREEEQQEKQGANDQAGLNYRTVLLRCPVPENVNRNFTSVTLQSVIFLGCETFVLRMLLMDDFRGDVSPQEPDCCRAVVSASP